METALYLMPVTLGDTPIESVLPSYNKEIILGISHFIVEDVRSARRFLKKVDREIDIDTLNGNLYLIGGFDPELMDEDLDSLVAAVEAQGIRYVTDTIAAEESLTDSGYF